MNKGLKNIFWGVAGQFLILALGIIVPRFILKSYGDEANGLINAITQIFTYLALIEAGIGQATVQALYKPIVEDDKNEINGILSATQKYYRKLTKIYMLIVLLVSVLYPLFIEVNDTHAINFFGSSYFAIMVLIVLHGVSSALGFYFTATLKQILLADGFSYVIVNITTIFRVAVSVAKIILINLGINLVLLQFVYLCITVAEVLVYIFIFRRYYPWVDFDVPEKAGALRERNAFLVHEISNAVFSGTDMLVLSIFCDLTTVSIYAMYMLVFSALNTLIGQAHNGCYYLLGQSYNSDKQAYENIHDTYDTYYIGIVFSLMTVAYFLILPFIELYTAGVTEINYLDSALPILFCLINLLSSCRITSSNLIKISGNAQATIPRTVTESVINLSASIILVNFIGIYGVLLGTIIALLYRTNDMVIYANKKILKRSAWKSYKLILTNFLIFFVLLIVKHFINLTINNFASFIVAGLITTIISMGVYFILNSLMNRQAFRTLKSALFKSKIKQ